MCVVIVTLTGLWWFRGTQGLKEDVGPLLRAWLAGVAAVLTHTAIALAALSLASALFFAARPIHLPPIIASHNELNGVTAFMISRDHREYMTNLHLWGQALGPADKLVLLDVGSDPPLVLPLSVAEMNVELYRIEADSFSWWRAFHAAVQMAETERVFFISPDNVPPPNFGFHHWLGDNWYFPRCESADEARGLASFTVVKSDTELCEYAIELDVTGTSLTAQSACASGDTTALGLPLLTAHVPLSGWLHVALSLDASTRSASLFVNGTTIAKLRGGDEWTVHDEGFSIKDFTLGNQLVLDGHNRHAAVGVRDVRLYSRYLDAHEVTILSLNGAAQPVGLRLLWPLESQRDLSSVGGGVGLVKGVVEGEPEVVTTDSGAFVRLDGVDDSISADTVDLAKANLNINKLTAAMWIKIPESMFQWKSGYYTLNLSVAKRDMIALLASLPMHILDSDSGNDYADELAIWYLSAQRAPAHFVHVGNHPVPPVHDDAKETFWRAFLYLNRFGTRTTTGTHSDSHELMQPDPSFCIGKGVVCKPAVLSALRWSGLYYSLELTLRSHLTWVLHSTLRAHLGPAKALIATVAVHVLVAHAVCSVLRALMRPRSQNVVVRWVEGNSSLPMWRSKAA